MPKFNTVEATTDMNIYGTDYAQQVLLALRYFAQLHTEGGGGPRAQGSGSHRCLSRQSSGFGSPARRFKRNKNVSSLSTCKPQYCGEPP